MQNGSEMRKKKSCNMFNNSSLPTATTANKQFMVQDCYTAYLDRQFLVLEELVHLCSSLLLTKGGLSHNFQLVFQCNIVGPGVLESAAHTYADRACLLKPEWQYGNRHTF